MSEAPTAMTAATTGYQERRQRELSSLYATARALTALGDLDAVLQAIVHHAHDLVATDLTYLSLPVADGSLQIQASEGSISAEFRAARIPHGAGLGGRVIAERAPHWVTDYLAAAELVHDRDFDDVVTREGLVALLGVPLVVRGQAVGALFAADRSPRDFTTEEIALFGAFADHAAVALDNARLYEESREALQELRAAYAVIERADALHEALSRTVLAGGGPSEVGAELVDHLGGGVVVLAPGGVVLAAAGSGTGEEIDDLVAEARTSGRAASCTTDDGRHLAAAVVRSGDVELGSLAWQSGPGSDPVDLRTLERASQVVGLLVLKENAATAAAERVSRQLVTDLVASGGGADETLRGRLRSRGVDPDALALVVVVHGEDVATRTVAQALHEVAARHQGLAGDHLGRAVLLLPSDDDAAVLAAVHDELRRRLGRLLGVVGERVRGGDWIRAFTVAVGCCDVARELGRGAAPVLASELAPFSLVIDPTRAADLHEFLGATVGPLVEYDARHGTALVATAAAYFAARCNLAATARDLHVHTNTLGKRLDRISAVLGEEWRGADALRVQLALELHRLSSP